MFMKTLEFCTNDLNVLFPRNRYEHRTSDGTRILNRAVMERAEAGSPWYLPSFESPIYILPRPDKQSPDWQYLLNLYVHRDSSS